MEGLEGMKAEDVSGVGQAADIIEWMRRECPDMVAVAPLLKELRFTGFSDSRSVRRLFSDNIPNANPMLPRTLQCYIYPTDRMAGQMSKLNPFLLSYHA